MFTQISPAVFLFLATVSYSKILQFGDRICGRNARYQLCATSCPKNCQNFRFKTSLQQRTVSCSGHCVYACRCRPGYVFLNGTSGDCIEPERCGLGFPPDEIPKSIFSAYQEDEIPELQIATPQPSPVPLEIWNPSTSATTESIQPTPSYSNDLEAQIAQFIQQSIQSRENINPIVDQFLPAEKPPSQSTDHPEELTTTRPLKSEIDPFQYELYQQLQQTNRQQSQQSNAGSQHHHQLPPQSWISVSENVRQIPEQQSNSISEEPQPSWNDASPSAPPPPEHLPFSDELSVTDQPQAERSGKPKYSWWQVEESKALAKLQQEASSAKRGRHQVVAEESYFDS